MAKKKTTELAPRRDLTPTEQARVERYQERVEQSGALLKFESEGDRLIASRKDDAPVNSGQLAQAELFETTGAVEQALAFAFMKDAANASRDKTSANAEELSLYSAFARGVAPSNELEGALVAQMWATHRRMLKTASWAACQDTSQSAQRIGGLAIRFGNLFTRQVETLLKLRGQHGKQTVRVEHVTVEAGGQAVVGNVAGGGGGPAK